MTDVNGWLSLPPHSLVAGANPPFHLDRNLTGIGRIGSLIIGAIYDTV